MIRYQKTLITVYQAPCVPCVSPQSVGAWSGSRRNVSILVLTCIIATVPVLNLRTAADERKPAPPPDNAAVTTNQEIIRGLYKAEYASRKPEERTELAKKLLKQGLESTGDVATRYVLLREARDVAAGGGDAGTALRAHDQLAKEFAIAATAEKVSLVTTLGRTVRTADGARDVIAAAMTLIDQLVAEDNFTMAKQVGNTAVAVSRKAGKPELAAAVQARMKDIETGKRECEKAKTALATLETNPEDADARLVAGRYVCVCKQDFDRGLKWLVSCGNADLETLAKADLAAPTEAAAQFRLGEAWHAYAAKQKDPDKSVWLSRAAFWYGKAKPKLDGILKLQIDAKLKQIADQGGSNVQVANAELLTNTITQFNWQIEWNDGTTSPMTFSTNGEGRSPSHHGRWHLEGTTVVFVAGNGDFQRHQLVNGRLMSEFYQKGETKPAKQGVGKPAP